MPSDSGEPLMPPPEHARHTAAARRRLAELLDPKTDQKHAVVTWLGDQLDLQHLLVLSNWSNPGAKADHPGAPVASRRLTDGSRTSWSPDQLAAHAVEHDVELYSNDTGFGRFVGLRRSTKSERGVYLVGWGGMERLDRALNLRK